MKKSTAPPRVFIGLGNPGDEYALTYHNVGAAAVTKFASWHSASSWRTDSSKLFRYAKTPEIVFTIPLTFMNNSGGAVKTILKTFGIKSDSLVLAHDDSDMIIGTYKISSDQRSAGHRGVQSIIDVLGTKGFFRLKIGVRPEKEVKRKKADEFVLKKMRKKEEEILEKLFEDAYRELF